MSATAGVDHMSPFASAAPELLALGYHPIPIQPGHKAPGNYTRGQWGGMVGWERFRDRAPTDYEMRLWCSNFPDANIGLVMGSPIAGDFYVMAVDIDAPDYDDQQTILRGCPHSVMSKRGAKGLTLFFKMRKGLKTAAYNRTADRVRLVDILTGFDTRQTVVPGSVHPSGVTYTWLSGPVPPADLTEFTIDDMIALEETLEGLGCVAAEPAPRADRAAIPADDDDYFAETKRMALANLDAWVPDLDLYDCRRARQGYEAVATWRPSNSGKPDEKRKRNLSIQPSGISDFGDGPKGYSAIDLVMAATGCDQPAATAWLRSRLGLDTPGVVIAQDFGARQPPPSAPPSRQIELVQVTDPATGEVSSIDPLARPYVWREPSSLPMRRFLYGRHLIRQFMSCTFAPGGVGKSALGLAEACAMASGYNLLGTLPVERLRVWVWSGEDPQEETERRVAAINLHYGLKRSDLEGWLFLGSGRETDLVIAEQSRGGATIQVPQVDRVRRMMTALKIDVAIIDPFVSTHRVIENDNAQIDVVAKQWAKIAGETNAAIDLVHHTRKTGGGEVTVEDGRGATALLNAARSARVLNTMTQEEANKYGLKNRRSHFRADNGKANLAPPPDGADWFRFHSVMLNNGGMEGGDNVGVVAQWLPAQSATYEVDPAKIFAIQERVILEPYRDDIRSPQWVGNLIAEVLAIDIQAPEGKAQVKSYIATWKARGWLGIDNRMDRNREMRPFISCPNRIDPDVPQS